MYNFSEELVNQFKLQAEINNSQSEVNINELMEHFEKLKKIEKPYDNETIKENLEIIKSIIKHKKNPTT